LKDTGEAKRVEEDCADFILQSILESEWREQQGKKE